MRLAIFKRIRWLLIPALLAVFAAAAPGAPVRAAAGSSGIMCTSDAINGTNPHFSLTASADYISMPDGNTLWTWSYGTSGGGFQFPGPVLCVNQGDTVTVVLNNSLPEATSIMFLGVDNVQANGVPNAEGGEGAANGWTASRIYAELAAGHPVMAWTETGWGHPYVGYWTTFDEKIQIRYSLIEHVVTLSGVSPTQVRVNDPWHSGSQYWYPKAAFEASWADFNNMAIVLQ